MTNEELTETILEILKIQEQQARTISNIVQTLSFMTGTATVLGEVQ